MRSLAATSLLLSLASTAEARCKNVKIRIIETFDALYPQCLGEGRELPNGCAGGPRIAGDYDTWDDNLYLMADIDPAERPVPDPMIFGKLTERLGKHRGRCMWVGADANHCEGSMVIEHPDYGYGSFSIMGQTPLPIGEFGPSNPDVRFTISGGTGDFEGAYGSVTPGVQFAYDPDFTVSEKELFEYPLALYGQSFAALGYPDQMLGFADFATYPFAVWGVPGFVGAVDPTFPFGTYTYTPDVFQVIVYDAQFTCSKDISSE